MLFYLHNQKGYRGMDASTLPMLILVVAIGALGFFVVRFGSSMNRLEQQVSDLQDRIDSMSKG
ncbi:MAG TPA: hypothetical protein VLA52_16860 [Thermohalobaculum sp.]|nr:hypothetical protein [Thermohalobaculum sp.]